MDVSYLSFLLTNDFRCVFRYYYGVNTNTDKCRYLQKQQQKIGIVQHGRPRTDCFFRNSLIRVFPVCYSDNSELLQLLGFLVKNGLMHEYSRTGQAFS